jgi:hypothetical protein
MQQSNGIPILHESVHVPGGGYGSRRYRLPWYLGVPVITLLWMAVVLASVYTVWYLKGIGVL